MGGNGEIVWSENLTKCPPSVLVPASLETMEVGDVCGCECFVGCV